MEQAFPSLETSSPIKPNSEEFQLRVEFFRKLGYSLVEVQSALMKLGLSTDTNSVLGELVHSGASAVTSTSSSHESGEDGTSSIGVCKSSRNQGSPRDSPVSSLEYRSDTDSELKPIVIDGSNVAMSHGNKEVFSCRGIELAVNYFLDRGHSTITVFVPSWRKEQPRPDVPITEQNLLLELEKKKIVVFTPSRRVGGKRVVCYDDRFIVKLAYESDGVIVSNDTYRDLQAERPEWKRCIEERLLMYSFVSDKFMPPDDPLGRRGPSLDNFLRKKPLLPEQKRHPCPYGKKCTYGVKCKFYHPERTQQSHRSLADELREKAMLSTVNEGRIPNPLSRGAPLSDPGLFHSTSLDHDLERMSLDQPASPGVGHKLTEKTFSGNQHDNGHRPLGCVPCKLSSSNAAEIPCASMPYECLDSGFGSYESLSPYSNISRGHSKAFRPRQQQGFPSDSRHPGLHPERLPQDGPQARGCCFQLASTAGPQQQHHHANPQLESLSQSQPRYDPYSPPLYPPSMNRQDHYSLPSSFQQGSHLHQHPQNYWSDPFHGEVHQARASYSLPCGPQHHHAPPNPHRSSSYGKQQSWSHPTPPAFDPEREELRKKLQAIFNPHQVDTVMGMFPHLMDAQKLAAEILNLKSQGVSF